jgi:hypothetical protein
MSNTILIKRSGTANAVPASGNLALGELAINYQDGNLFYKDAAGTVQTIASKQFVSVSGNITGGNVNAAGLSLSGNVLSAINSTSNITTSANVSGNYILGNGYFLTGVITSVANINLGNSNVTVVSSGGNITVGVGGTSNVVVFATTGQYTTGEISATGNITGNYFIGNGSQLTGVTASGVNANNLTGNTLSSNVLFSSLTSVGVLTGLSVSGGVQVNGNIASNTVISATGTITGGNLATGGNISAGGNITGGNITTAGSSGNIFGANVISGTTLSAISAVVTSGISATGTVNFASSGNISLGNVGNVHIAGGSNGYLLTTDGSGNLTWTQTASTTEIYNGNSNVTIPFANGNVYINANAAVDQQWNFDTTGNLAFPGGGIIYGVPTTPLGTGNTIVLQPAGSGVNTTQQLLIYPTGNVADGDHIHLTSGNLLQTELFLGSDDFYVKLANTGNIVLNSSGNTGQWVFDTTGNLSASGNIITTANVNGANFNGNVFGTTVSASGNITGGNLNAAGLSLSGNVLSALNSTSNITTSANVTAANFATSGASGNITGANVVEAVTLSATSGVLTANLSLSGNVLSNLNSTSNITTSANITGGNILFGSGVVSGTGNIISGNLNAAGLSLSSNVLSELNSTSNITTTANITGGNILGGSGIISTSGNITGGNLNAAGLSLSSNVLSELNSTSNITTTANITGGNILGGSGIISTSGNITGGNLNAAGLSLSSNVVSDLNSTSNITTSANISGGNVLSTYLSASGNVDGSNVNVGTTLYTPSIVGNTAITITTTANANINLQPNGTGNIVLSNTVINGLAEPQQNQDAATKYYVDNLVTTGFAFHAPVFATTNTDLATATGGSITYAQPNGAANGIGATLTTTGSFNLIDTANIQTVGTRVLVKNEGNAVYNGVYTWSNATVIVRSTDTDQYGPDSTEDLSLNDYFFTQSGNVNAGAAFVVSAPPGTITFGTSNIEFSQFSSTQVYSANTNAGLNLVGTTFSAKVDNDTTAFDVGGNIIVKASANLVTPNIGNATGQTLSVTGTVTAGNVDAGSGFISTGGNVTGGNILTGGLISATGNLTAGNISTAGSNGNISGANVISGTTLSATGNVIAGNLNAAGLSLSSNVVSNLNVTTNIAGGNISTVGLLTAKDFSIVGNVIGNLIPSANATYNLGSSSYLWKDLYLAGNSLYLGAQTISSNATGVSVGSADFAAGNINTTGNVSAVGNVNTGNVVNGGGNLTLTANTKIWNFSQNGNLYVPEASQIRASSSFYGVTVSDYSSLAVLSLVDDATLQGNTYVRLQVIGGTQFDFSNGLANLKDANLSTTGNVIGGNILFGSGIVSGTGNVNGNNFNGNVFATFVSATGNVIAGNVTFGSGVVTGTGNIIGGNILFGSGIVSGTGNITGGNIFQGSYQVLDTASTVDGGLY